MSRNCISNPRHKRDPTEELISILSLCFVHNGTIVNFIPRTRQSLHNKALLAGFVSRTFRYNGVLWARKGLGPDIFSPHSS